MKQLDQHHKVCFTYIFNLIQYSFLVPLLHSFELSRSFLCQIYDTVLFFGICSHGSLTNETKYHEHAFKYKVSQKKCELLLLLQVVIHTFFWDTLYIKACSWYFVSLVRYPCDQSTRKQNCIVYLTQKTSWKFKGMQ